MIPQIPYAAIGLGISFLLGIWAIIEAETIEGRLLIIGVMVGLFFLRVLWPTRLGSIVWQLGWIVFGISCFIFIKWRGVRIP